MTHNAQIEKKQGFFYKLLALFLIGVFCALIYVVVAFMGEILLENIDRLRRRSLYVAVSSWDVPLIFALPGFVALIILFILRLFDIATENRVNKCFKVIVAFAGVLLVTRLIYGFSAESYMEQREYSACWHYSSPAVMSPTIWVKNKGFCIKNAGVVRRDALEWLDALPNSGADISEKEVREYVNSLIDAWEQEQREKYALSFN